MIDEEKSLFAFCGDWELLGGSRSTTILVEGGEERKLKAASDGGVANRELESPSWEVLSRLLMLFLYLPQS